MGGRGTFAAGNPVPYVYNVDTTFSPDGKWEGVKILKGTGTQHGLPESSHSSPAYIKLGQNGNFKEIRFYDKNHCLYFEIGYHSEKNVDASGKPVLHYHTYDPSFSMMKEGNGGRSKAMKLTKSMKKHFRKYFKGVSL